jgi:hypothetical protein
MMAKGPKVPKVEDWVVLRQHPIRWIKLPVYVRLGLRKKVGEVLAIRASIAANAKVPIMPPVEITDVAWQSADQERCFHGAAGIIRVGRKRETQFGVRLPGASVLWADRTTLRGILLHEFSHCFWNIRQELAVSDVEEDDDQRVRLGCESREPWDDDSESDRSTLEDPRDWFGPEDCAAFLYGESGDLAGCTELVASQWIAKGLPWETPPEPVEYNGVVVPEVTIAHIKRLDRATAAASCASAP